MLDINLIFVKYKNYKNRVLQDLIFKSTYLLVLNYILNIMLDMDLCSIRSGSGHPSSY